jgi:AAA family ATPase
MVVMTSNKAYEINQAMIRPGRIDAILHIGPPDAGAVQRLLRAYGRKLIRPDEDLTEAGDILSGRIPAVIREVVERSKLYAISRAPGAEFFDRCDIVRSAKGWRIT